MHRPFTGMVDNKQCNNKVCSELTGAFYQVDPFIHESVGGQGSCPIKTQGCEVKRLSALQGVHPSVCLAERHL